MDLKKKFWVFSVVFFLMLAIVPIGIVVYFWFITSPEVWSSLVSKFDHHTPFFAFILLAIFTVLLFILNAVFHYYILPIYQLADETMIIATVNPGHRINIRAGKEILRLARCINDTAERLQEMQCTIGERLNQADSSLEEERNTLATVISELPEGIIVCGIEGQIILYNSQAKELICGFSQQNNSFSSCGYLGLGRQISDLFDRYLIRHAIYKIKQKHHYQEKDRDYSFMCQGLTDRLFKAQMVPITSVGLELFGFILVMHDVTEIMEMDQRSKESIRSFIEDTRETASSICSSLNTLLQYPEASNPEFERFQDIICYNADILSQELEQTFQKRNTAFKTQWPMEDIDLSDFLSVFQMAVEEKSNLTVDQGCIQVGMIININLFVLIKSLLQIGDLLEKDLGLESINCSVFKDKDNDRAVLEIVWQGSPLTEQMINNWQESSLAGFMQIKEVLERHEAKIFIGSNQEEEQAFFQIWLPEKRTENEFECQGPICYPSLHSRFYDFQLMKNPPDNSTMENALLSELIYTVFDLETTGLDPEGGDEIISISAIRIVNCHVLLDETFDYLINPGCSVPWKSTQIHGISTDMLKNKPPPEEILPQFQKFAQGTVLVAHSADLDMAFLRKKEIVLGLNFSNPVLDTFKLSHLVHPSQKNHDLESIAERLGIKVYSRHSSFGDALTTTQILINLIPLLAKKGIYTLKQAQDVCQRKIKTLYTAEQ